MWILIQLSFWGHFIQMRQELWIELLFITFDNTLFYSSVLFNNNNQEASWNELQCGSNFRRTWINPFILEPGLCKGRRSSLLCFNDLTFISHSLLTYNWNWRGSTGKRQYLVQPLIPRNISWMKSAQTDVTVNTNHFGVFLMTYIPAVFFIQTEKGVFFLLFFLL